MSDNIPSVDLADYLSNNPGSKKKFVNDLGRAFNEVGFVAVKNHRLSEELVNKLYEAFQSFFSLPDEKKAVYDIPGLAGQRGYTGKGKEHAKGRNTGDLKEFYHVGQENGKKDDLINYPSNIWPDEVPALRETGLEAYRRLEETGKDLLKAIAEYLELPEDYFEQKVTGGNSILRAIHYYPITDPDNVPADAVRAAEHEDINLITLLMGASADGLEILRKDGQWIKVTALPDQIVVNVGDMLARLTNDRLKSTTHRVVNPPRELMHTSRFSIPFFLHPVPDMNLTCLPNCISAVNPRNYSDMTAGEFLDERLRELGLKK
jgi:isopenicillin N synthase-like dioxygenase